MMKRILAALLILGALSFATAEAKRACGSCKPKCTTKVEKRYVNRPCKKWILVDGTTKHEICKTITTCEKETERCIEGCNGKCPNGPRAVADNDMEEEMNDNE